MLFLRAHRTDATSAWWAAAATAAKERPVIIGELLRGDSVVCERPEASEAIAWAERLKGWNASTPAIWLEDSIASRLAHGVPDLPPGIAPAENATDGEQASASGEVSAS